MAEGAGTAEEAGEVLEAESEAAASEAEPAVAQRAANAAETGLQPEVAEGDELLALALAAVSKQRDAFRSALALTLDQVRNGVEVQTAGEDRAERAAVELGTFARGKIDPESFARLTAASASEDDSWLAPARRALDTLRALSARKDELFRVRVEPGGDLYAAVDRALAEAGRAFGAARVYELARAGRYAAAEHDPLLASFPFRRWKAAEREKAPPLVVELAGGDMVVGGLASFLDGTLKIVLIVRGESPPAPLVRLVTPGILVLQTSEPDQLSLVRTAAGPAIAALVPPEAGAFVHEPSGSDARVEVRHIPEKEAKRAVGQVSAFQQAEELRLLRSLAEGAPARSRGRSEPSAGGSPAEAAAPPADPVDKLAAWLLRQADLSDLEPGT
ncbi:MAG: hypothetical protein JSV95_06145 [Gemmatimonadota bacterium]|jgi:hypothetical protein|nr:MAG: hypothetical protein JSV95_06145 [Gemmatimonadota bacterium]